MQAARSITGVCPQFDVLWEEMTAREHMLLYADVKGLPWAQRDQAALELLEKVKDITIQQNALLFLTSYIS
jgi:ABC-type multidrug transport system ATPase subunit